MLDSVNAAASVESVCQQHWLSKHVVEVWCAEATRIGFVGLSVHQSDNDSNDVVDGSGIVCESWYCIIVWLCHYIVLLYTRRYLLLFPINILVGLGLRTS